MSDDTKERISLQEQEELYRETLHGESGEAIARHRGLRAAPEHPGRNTVALDPLAEQAMLGWVRGGGKSSLIESETAQKLAEAIRDDTFSIELVKRLRANTFYVPPGGLVAQAIDFLLAERDRQKGVIDRLTDYNNEAAADFDRANNERLKLVAERDRQAGDVARLKEDKERLGREVSRLNDVINERRQELVILQEKHANQSNTIKNLQGECEELAAQRDCVNSWLEQRDTTIRDMRQQLVMAQQRGDELKERCEGLVDRISDMEKREATWDNGQGATYWRTQYEKLSQEHAVVVRDLTAQANHYKEELNGLIHANATGAAPEMQFFACEDIGGHRCAIDPDAVILARWNLEYPDRLHCELEDDTLIFAGNEAVRVWEHLLARPR